MERHVGPDQLDGVTIIVGEFAAVLDYVSESNQMCSHSGELLPASWTSLCSRGIFLLKAVQRAILSQGCTSDTLQRLPILKGV